MRSSGSTTLREGGARARLLAAACGLALLLGLPGTAWSLAELADFEAFANVAPGDGSEFPAGVVGVEWGVFEQLQALQYIFVAASPTSTTPIELDLMAEQVEDTNTFLDDRDDLASLSFAESTDTLRMSVTILLRGAPAERGLSDLAETILVENLTTSTVYLQQLVVTSLLGDSEGDVRVFPEEDTGFTNRVRIEDGSNVFEEVVTPGAFFGEFIGGDPSFLLSWEIAPGETLLISKDKRLDVIPEPGTAALLGLGLAGLTIHGRRRARSLER